MKLLSDFLPVLLFFLVYKLFDIYTATAAAIVACIIQVAYSWFLCRKVETMQWVTCALLVVFGGATLLFHNEVFIKWKPTLVNLLFSGAFLLSHWVGKKTLIERMLGSSVTLPAPLWRALNLSWSGFFALMATLNLWVAYQFDTNTWVNFKLFGNLGLTLVFVLIQSLVLSRFLGEQHESDTP